MGLWEVICYEYVVNFFVVYVNPRSRYYCVVLDAFIHIQR